MIYTCISSPESSPQPTLFIPHGAGPCFFMQLSLREDLDPAAHLAAGEVLASLRDEGVLIVGNGMSFHNMRGYGDSRNTAPSEAFDDGLARAVAAETDRRHAALSDWTQAPHAYQCHPPGDEEHLIPLLGAAGAAREDRG
ncbi:MULTISPECIES: class III extradiol ring-cleavage dioxygenase [unclassified Halomonas]|uniref:DODA-type extradiol aromatic ring-opening family dioxygenase n=1 Tax=unclassified Halomonas TaxID=2609666 RepID=UPI0028871159|nr:MULTISPECIES: class III extradiol ring-cleavage dioxygenase [unclassified Halomonas]MDT0499825.1 class III extradiol ring-cleavage dioxygenase [Halomonas sp. PAR7]MDT0510358.1 class III extradiol ring-cleavage dioxygenase [Halomonas sp. LES1]MDT0589933.1 class III extradiol ring-cleavage dioxygenase [Halomonas sp. PAR8]